MKYRIALAAGFIALAAAAPAHAEDFEFPYMHSELATAEGREALYDRLETAARHFCRDAAPMATLAPRRTICERQVIAETIKGFDHPLLTALFEDATAA